MSATNLRIYLSGPGSAVWTQNCDYLGNIIAFPTPSLLGVLQDHSTEEKKDTKMLFGDQNRPVAIMGGKMTTSINVKLGTLDQILLNSMYYGQTVTSGTLVGIYLDTTGGTAIPTTPFQITVTPPNSGTFTRDLGVINTATNKRFVPVTSSPAAGQYSVNSSTGVYTFASADNVSAIKVWINYEYTATVADATSATVLQAPIGPIVTGSLDIIERSSTGSFRKISYSNVVCSDYKGPAKQDDFMIHELKFEPFLGAGGSFVKISEYNV